MNRFSRGNNFNWGKIKQKTKTTKKIVSESEGRWKAKQKYLAELD